MWKYLVTKGERGNILKKLRVKIKNCDKCKKNCDICNAWRTEVFELDKKPKEGYYTLKIDLIQRNLV